MNAHQMPFPKPDDPFFGPGIFSYTRAQALADGVLVDVTETAKEAGFKLPVAITEALHSRLTPTKADQSLGQDYEGTDTVNYTVVLQEAEAQSGQPQNIDLRLRAVCGPGDEGEPVVTIGFPEDF
jgi:hypothetical protein